MARVAWTCTGGVLRGTCFGVSGAQQTHASDIDVQQLQQNLHSIKYFGEIESYCVVELPMGMDTVA